MNLVSSKMLRSSKAVNNRSVQTVQAYSCELYIDSFKVTHRGFVYFVWHTNTTQINSLRYESTGRTVPVKETLTISLRVASKNGKEYPLNTYLKLMAQDGDELDEVELPINGLTAHFKDIEIPMDRGLCVAKMRRKQMNLGDDLQVSHHRTLFRSRNNQIADKQSMISAEYESVQEELNRVKKELEDQVYLNNKLKNDRDVLLATKQDLQMQIETILVQTSKEHKMLREHYDTRISIREHSYEEEIENLVNMFNADAAHSKKVVEMLMKQKIKFEDELRLIEQKLKANERQMAQRQNRISNLQNETHDQRLTISQLQGELSNKQKELQAVQQSGQNIKITLESRIQDLEIQIQEFKLRVGDQDSQISQLAQKCMQLEEEIRNKDAQNLALGESLQATKDKEQALARQRDLITREIQLLQEDKQRLAEEVDTLKAKVEECEFEMDFNENVMGQLKKQQMQKEEELYQQLQNLQKIYEKKIEDLLANYQNEKQKIENYSELAQKEKEELESRIKDLQEIADGSQVKIQQLSHELEHLQSEVQDKNVTVDAKDQTISQLEAELRLIKEELANAKNQPPLSRVKSSKSLKSNPPEPGPSPISNSTVENLSQRVKKLEEQNSELLKEIEGLRKATDSKDQQIQQLKVELDNQHQVKLAKLDSKRVRSHRSSQNEGFLQKFREEDIQGMIDKKEEQINELKRKIDELQNLYLYLQQRLDKIIEMYPHVDLSKIDAEIPVIERCDSEEEEEIQLNKAMSIHNGSAQTPQHLKKASIAEDFAAYQQQANRDHKNSLQPRSETKIIDSKEIALIKENSGQDSTKGYPPTGKMYDSPKGRPYLKKVSVAASIREDLSEKSGASWVKVSHSKKIRQLEGTIYELEKKQKGYLRQIEGLKSNIASLQVEIEKSNKLQLVQQRQLSPTFRLSNQPQKVNTESQVLLEDERLKNLIEDCKLKEAQIGKRDLRIGQLEDQLKSNNLLKIQQSNRLVLLEQKLLQSERREGDWYKKIEALTDINKQLQKDLAEWQEKLRREKESTQEARLSLKQAHMHLENAQAELKKLRSHNQVLEQKVNKLAGSELVIRELSKEIEDMGKKSLEQTRTINHLKLEKDASDEELRLLKKRQNDHIRIATEWEEKAASLQRTIEEAKRKESKLKREVEDSQEEVRRSKLQQKKLEDQLQALSSAQIGWQVERRKYLDQISSIQDQLSRKEYDLNKMNKEIERWRSKAQDRDDIRLGKKSQLREEIERLENEMIRKEKKLFEEAQQNKLLRSRLELLQKENKRIMEQKNQTYGEKLRYYVDQMGSIKKLLEEYQNENSRLKIDNNDLYEQYEMIRSDYDKLQMRYDEAMMREEDIIADLHANIEETNTLKDKLNVAHRDVMQLETSFASLRTEADEQKQRSKKLMERVESADRNSENAQNEVRELRLKLSEFETNFEISSKIADRYKLLQRKKTQLEEDCKRLKGENQHLKVTFTFSREDLEKAISEVRTQERKMRQQQIQALQQQYNKAATSKTQRLEQELLEVYNENNRIRTDLQVLHQENGRQKGRIIQLQIICQTDNALQAENSTLKYDIEQLRGELRKKDQKLGKAQVTIEGIESQYHLKEREINGLKTRVKQLQGSIDKLNEEIKVRRSAQREMQEALVKATSQKGKEKSEEDVLQKQRQLQIIQQYQSKITHYEAELQRAKDKQARSVQENNMKMKKLQQKMDEMEQALKEKEKAIESHFITEVQDLENSLLKISDELKEKMAQIDELNEAIIILEEDNVDLSRQIQDLNYKHQEQRQFLQTELNKLKIKYKESQVAYTANLKALEDEVTRATQLKANNTSNSRTKTNEAEERVSKRYEDKLKTKDKKIEQLKENIYTLEETILKMKKKQSNLQTILAEVQNYKLVMAQYEKEKKKMQLEWEAELSKHAETIRQLRKEILRLKEEEEQARLSAEQRTMQNESLVVELKTVRELYQQLQRQLQRRKNNLTQQLQEESSLQYQLRMEERKVAELEERVLDYIKKIKELELQQRKKSTEIKKHLQHIQVFKRNEQTYKVEIGKLNEEISACKHSVQELNTSSQSTKSELKFSRAEIARLKKIQEDLRVSNQTKEQDLTELKRINEDIMNRYRNCEETARRYTILNERSREELGCSIEQLVQRYSIVLEEKDAETNGLIEEIEELKFLNERKYMDYDEMKKTNFQLQLKVEEYEALGDQLETLRRICDKLQEQKKNAVFKQEVLRMQIENLAVSAPQGMRARIESILAAPIIPSYSNFSFY